MQTMPNSSCGPILRGFAASTREVSFGTARLAESHTNVVLFLRTTVVRLCAQRKRSRGRVGATRQQQVSPTKIASDRAFEFFHSQRRSSHRGSTNAHHGC